MRRLALLPLLALALLAAGPGGPPAHGAAAAPAGPLRLQLALAPQELRCDGDTARLAVTVTQADGTPAAGAAVTIVLPEGGGTATLGRTTAATVNGWTDRRGVLRGRLTPAAGTRTAFSYVVAVRGGPAPRPSVAACPFPAGGGMTLRGTAVRAGDGAAGRPLAGQRVSVYGECYGPGCFVPLHTTRTDAAGAFAFSGLPRFAPGPGPRWHLCVEDRPGARAIVSLDGAPLPPDAVLPVAVLGGAAVPPQRCVALGALTADLTAVTLGLR